MRNPMIVWVGLFTVLSIFLGSDMASAQQEEDVSDTTSAQQEEADVSDMAPVQQQEEEDVSDMAPAQQKEADVSDTTSAQQQETDVSDTTRAEQQEADVSDTTRAEQQEADVSDMTPLQQQEADVSDMAPAQQQEEEDVSDMAPAQQEEATDVSDTTPAEQKQVDEEKRARMKALQERIEKCKRLEYEIMQIKIAELKAAEDQLIARLKAQKKALEAERQSLQGDRSQTIASFESLLRKYEGKELDVADIQLINDARFKLGQLYYEQADEIYRAAMSRFMTEQVRHDQGLIPFLPQEPKRDLSRSIVMYRKIVESSGDPGTVAYSLYSIGWSYYEQKNFEKALQTFQELVERSPNDPQNAPDAYSMIGEYYFERPGLPGNEDFNLAVAAYKKILPFWQSSRYPEALYRLGWCAFNNREYHEAIGYFTLLVDEIDWFNTQEISNKELSINPAFREEALAYIGLSFWEMGLEALSQGGDETATAEVVEKAAAYAKSKAGKLYAPEILEKLGQIYFEAGGQDPRFVRDSSHAYRRLLETFPDYVKAPWIHRELALNFQRLGQTDEGYREYEQLFVRYNRTGPWAKAKASELSPEQIQEADSLAAYCLLEASKYTYTQAGGEPKRVREAADKFKRYLDYYAQSKEAYEINWNLANIYYTELQDYDMAWEEYMRVSREYDQDTHREKAAYQAVVVAQKMAEAQ